MKTVSPTTIIIPTFNRPEMLRECLDAIQRQTVTALEVIIVNDGGETGPLPQSLDRQTPVRVLHQNNAGKSVALNAALRQARGDYIWIVDDDDLALPTALATLTDLLYASPEAGFAFGRHNRFDVGPDGTHRVFNTGFWCTTTPDRFLLATLEDFFAHQTGMLVRRDAYERVGVFDEALFRSLDYEMSLRLARSLRPVMTDEIVFLQRQHSGQRGPNADRFASKSLEAKWIESDQAIFRRLRQEWPLELFLVSRSISTVEEHRSALIQRGGVMARKKLWPEALEDWTRSAELANSPISPDDQKALRRAFHGKYGCAEAFANGIVFRSLCTFAQDKRHSRMARALAPGLLRQIKSEFEKGRFLRGLKAAHLMGKLFL